MDFVALVLGILLDYNDTVLNIFYGELEGNFGV